MSFDESLFSAVSLFELLNKFELKEKESGYYNITIVFLHSRAMAGYALFWDEMHI